MTTDRLIARWKGRALRAITEFYSSRYLAHAVPAPSGRFGIYAVASELFSPGDQVLVSPLTCHTVIQSLLAAKVVPAFVDIDLDTGNIDLRRLTAPMLDGAKGIVTTNLYGNPDAADELQRLTRRRGIYLIEDCAHVLHTTIAGRPIGSFGDASIFSFKKYFGRPGGVVTTADRNLADRLVRRMAAEAMTPTIREEVLRMAQYWAERAGGALFARTLSRAARAIRPSAAETQIPDRAGETPAAGTVFPTAAALLDVAASLSRYDRIVAQRQRDAEALIRSSTFAALKDARAEELCYMVVPFWTERRDELIERMGRRGIPTYFTYCPPMNRVFAERARCDYLTAGKLDEWRRRLLPVNVAAGREFLEEVRA